MRINVNTFSEPCPCGSKHQISVKDIIIEEGAINKLPEYISSIFQGNSEYIGIICDENTYEAAGKKVALLFAGCKLICLPSSNLHADNHGVHITEEKMKDYPNIKLILAVGAGTIHDISRYIANQYNIPFVSIPTAASVDGFVSTVAAMTWDGFKKTLPAVAPVLVVADSSVFSKAPYRLTASGISDLLGKYTALADWEIAHLVTGEYICERVCDLEVQALKEVTACLDDLKQEDNHPQKIQAYEQLMYALLLSGIAMQMVGNSRPASGAEHHISHLWEMEVINGHLDAYHGEKVSIGLLLAVKTYEKVKKALKKGTYKVKCHDGLEYDKLKEAFGLKGLYEGMLSENTPDPLADIDIKKMESVIPEIITILDKLPSEAGLYQILNNAGCKKDVKEIGLDEEIIENTLVLSPYVRNRLTFMRMIKLLELNSL